MIERCGFKEESQIMLPAIANRMIKTPYPENCKFRRQLKSLELPMLLDF